MSVSRVYRLLRLITMLQSGRGYTVDELAKELEVSRRTVFRDLNMLELAHIPYYFDRRRRSYRINQHFFLSPVNLTLAEALALLVSAKRTRGSSMLPLAASSTRAAMKLESVLPHGVRDYLGTVMDQVAIVPAPSARQRGLDAVFDRLVSAVAGRKVCRIVYISFYERKQITLKVEPLRLLFVSRAWYLIGYSRMHRQRRTFKIGRIRKLTVLDETFDPSVHETSQREFGDAWHHSQQVDWRADGSIDFRARVDGLGEILWWILGYGDQVKVIAPRVLARQVAGMARRVVAQYREV